ncbi:hypothetical protein SLEP1_g202 [Rubroshorea leprosula]|uniref:DC1 domain-containing protein n=1 Tax=Rubroshorea leprosula TaxID=152421 RepID=A0AAV5HJ20_9ROSI|nr:hypothetical protein SLEP1_g202 [Rubroshorea leprosula]
MPTTELDVGQIQHFTHGHPLQPVDPNKEVEVSCSFCRKLCSYAAYGCEKCNFFLHQSCMDIPRKIHGHSFHPQHTLVLLTTPSYKCKACDKNRTGLLYKCGRCDFELNVGCTFFLTIDCEAVQWIPHIYHQHPLQYCKTIRFVTDAIFFLHRACAIELLSQTVEHHPLHPKHRLLIKSNRYQGIMVCKACGSYGSEVLACCCEDCSNFQMHLDCSSLTPSISFGDHWYLFTLF